MRARLLLPVAMLLACGPSVGADPVGGSSSGDATLGSTGAPNTSGSSSSTAGPAGSTSSGTSGGGADSSSTGCVVDGPAVPPDPENPDSRCLGGELEDACGCGYRCTVYRPDEEYGDSPWRNSGCFPVDPAPVGLGDPCVHEDFAWSGRDNCPEGSMCEDFDYDGQGVCREFCSPDFDYECAEPGAVPWAGCQECGCVCQVSCDPLGDDCDEGQACYLGNGLGVCTATLRDAGGIGDPCEFVNACGRGLACVNAEFGPDCDPDGYGCCTPYCDVAAPQCPDGTECVGLWEPGEATAPVLEGLGYCLIPEA